MEEDVPGAREYTVLEKQLKDAYHEVERITVKANEDAQAEQREHRIDESLRGLASLSQAPQTATGSAS